MSGAASTESRVADKGERIAKRIARSGVCSRRDAERLIAEGRVKLNGRVLSTPAITVGPADKIEVDGEPLAANERTRLFLLNKPKGLVTTNKDPEGRPTVFSVLPRELPRLMTIGRLDINTEGLLLLTNDGGLARVLELPSTGWLRRYRVRVHGTIDQPSLDRLRGGVTIDGMVYGAVEAKIDRVQGSNLWLTVGLREGKNREVRRVLERLGLSVNRLIRVSYGPFQLGELKPGEVEEVRGRVLREQLGEKLASAAGVDFAAPIRQLSTKDERAAPPSKRPKRDARRRRAL
jgi:23S rRNA pseudouridine2605 synthase